MRVSLFITCLADSLFPDVGKATVAVLERQGVEVSFDPGQTCCGQMHLNTGYQPEAKALVDDFAARYAGAEAVVLPSGSCAAMLRHHHETVSPGSVMPPIFELSEFLVDELGVTDVGASFPHTVTYHPTCHSTRLLGVGDRPYELLKAVRGLTLVPLPDDTQCCGFGGTFALKNADTSGAMGRAKIEHATQTGAEYLCASDASCLMHMQGIIEHKLPRTRSDLSTIHLAEILASR